MSLCSDLKEVLTPYAQRIKGLAAADEEIKADLADVDNHTVKSAEQLISDKRTVDKVPYKYRASQSGKSDRAYDCIVGGTVCFNQLCNGSSVNTVSGRKYLTKIGGAWSVASGAGSAITGLTSGVDMVMDLNVMFGTAIADHIYALEQATAGAGVALFRAMFNKEYYPFTTNQLISVEGLSAKEVVGFNLWDEEWANGYYSTRGIFINSSEYIASKNKVHILPDRYYCLTSLPAQIGRICFYDENKNFVETITGTAGTKYVFKAPQNIHYMTFDMKGEYGTTYNHDICINLSDPLKNGQYEPYHKTVYPLDNTLTLRGAPVLKDGKVEFDGDLYSANGTVTRRYGVVDLGTLTWLMLNAGYFYTQSIRTLVKKGDAQIGYSHIRCILYVAENVASLSALADKSMSVDSNGSIQIHDSTYSDRDVLKASLSGVMLVYELATPTTETATPYTSPQIVDPYGTEEYISETICPVGHITEYPDNLRAKIDGLPWNLSMIAPVEITYTATRNYTVGQLLIVDNTLYKVTANIANNGTITPNSNVTATTLSEIISTLA